jgi:hypothetical protein
MSNWSEVIFNSDKITIDGTLSADFLEEVSEIYNQTGSPADFAVYKDLVGDSAEIYYLTPVASGSCQSLLQKYHGVSCKDPSLAEKFKIFGDFKVIH